jgi:putative two-component system response regulator
MSDLSGKKKILIVDDARENIAILVETLKAEYKVVPALNGEKALKLASSENPPDLILLDIMMPGIDGHEVCRRLQADVSTKGIPVIFLSGKDSEDEKQKGIELGAVDYITKPIDPSVVTEKVKSHI